MHSRARNNAGDLQFERSLQRETGRYPVSRPPHPLARPFFAFPWPLLNARRSEALGIGRDVQNAAIRFCRRMSSPDVLAHSRCLKGARLWLTEPEEGFGIASLMPNKCYLCETFPLHSISICNTFIKKQHLALNALTSDRMHIERLVTSRCAVTLGLMMGLSTDDAFDKGRHALAPGWS